MKDNALINIKIGKKTTLCLVAILSLFAAADFVSLVDSKNAGGVIIEKETMNVGSVVLRMDDINPSDIYGGTWNLLTGDASLRFGDGENLTGAIEGSGNLKNVPLLKHTHGKGTMEITGQFGIGGNGGLRVASTSTSGAFYSGASGNSDGYGGGARTGNSMTYFKASRNWSGSTSETGETSPTMDVRGDYIKINVWQRTN